MEEHKFSRRNSFTTVTKVQIQSNCNQKCCCFSPGLRHSCLLEFQESTGERSLALAEKKVNTAVACSSNESYFYLKSPSSSKHCLENSKHKKHQKKKKKKSHKMVMESYYPTQALAINQGWADQAPNPYQPPGYHRCTAHLLQSVTHAWLKHKHPRSTSFPAHPCTDTHQRQNLAQKASSSSHPVYKRQEKCSVSSILPVHPAAVLVSSSACPAKLPQHCVSH